MSQVERGEWREEKGAKSTRTWLCVFNFLSPWTAGGMGHKGKVTELTNWSPASVRSAVYILWESNKKNLYRLGFEGRVSVCGDREQEGKEHEGCHK